MKPFSLVHGITSQVFVISVYIATTTLSLKYNTTSMREGNTKTEGRISLIEFSLIEWLLFLFSVPIYTLSPPSTSNTVYHMQLQRNY
jgi:hypothetical protein